MENFLNLVIVIVIENFSANFQLQLLYYSHYRVGHKFQQKKEKLASRPIRKLEMEQINHEVVQEVGPPMKTHQLRYLLRLCGVQFVKYTNGYFSYVWKLMAHPVVY